MSKRVISLSLYGREARYLEAVKPLVEDIAQFFPGYVPRFYVSQEIEEGLISQLRERGCEIIHKERKGGVDGTFWRFLAAADKEAERVLVRDVDTRMGLRDQQANEAWLRSAKDFHIIRDLPCHVKEIMGGLWSCRGEKIPQMAQWVDKWPFKRHYSDDELFLSIKVYPWVIDRAYIQSDTNVFRNEEVHPCPPFVDEHPTVDSMGGYMFGPQAKEEIKRIMPKRGKNIHALPVRIWVMIYALNRPFAICFRRFNCFLLYYLRSDFFGRLAQFLDSCWPFWMDSCLLYVWKLLYPFRKYESCLIKQIDKLRALKGQAIRRLKSIIDAD